MNYLDASALFEHAVVSRGHQASRQGDSIAVGNPSESLRLRAIPAGVILEITHGTEDKSEVSWHELYSDSLSTKELSLEDCIEYGLDLMILIQNGSKKMPNKAEMATPRKPSEHFGS